MIISELYSHKNAFGLLEDTEEWAQIKDALKSVEIKNHKTKISKEINKQGDILISPSSINRDIAEQMDKRGWCKKRRSFWMTKNVKELREGLYDSENTQKDTWGDEGLYSFMEVDFWKNHIGLEVQFGKYAFITHDFVKMKMFYELGLIDIGIELVPSKNMKKEMSSGPCYFEQAQLYLLPMEELLDFPILLIGVEESLDT